MILRIVILPLLGLLFSEIAMASLFMAEYQNLTKIKDKVICVTGSHRFDPKIGADPTNGTDPISCRIKIGATVKRKGSESHERFVNVAARTTYELNKVVETCIDFSHLLEANELLNEVLDLSGTCMSATELPKYRDKIGNDALTRAEIIDLMNDEKNAKKFGLPLITPF